MRQGPIAAFGVSFRWPLWTEIEVVANRICWRDGALRTILTRRMTTMPESSPWDDIAVPGADFNVRQVAVGTAVPCF
jgi:hypothetical protein